MELEIKRKMVYKWLNKQITAWKFGTSKLPYEHFGSAYGIVATSAKELHISGVQTIAEIIEVPVIREDWDGNAQCNTNHDIIYFWYRGFKVFQLVDKEEK